MGTHVLKACRVANISVLAYEVTARADLGTLAGLDTWWGRFELPVRVFFFFFPLLSVCAFCQWVFHKDNPLRPGAGVAVLRTSMINNVPAVETFIKDKSGYVV